MKLLLTTCKTCILNFFSCYFSLSASSRVFIASKLTGDFLVYCYNENVKVMERNNIYLFIFFSSH